MKKIVLLTMFIGCLPLSMMAQSEDDLYYVPSGKESINSSKSEKRVTSPTTIVKVAPSNNTTVIVRKYSSNKRTRNVDEYNRRYESSDTINYPVNNADAENSNDTLYIDEYKNSANAYDSDLDGKWVNGFDGSDDDYEYATRIIRFRNPRFAVSISSPYYWDIVYGLDSWDWNVYDDGLYAYAFPTFSNPLWWNWRFDSFGWGWGWNYGWPYYSYGWGYPYYYGSYWGYPYYSGRWYDGGLYAHQGGWYSPRGEGYWGWNGNHLAGVTYRNDRKGSYGSGILYSRGNNLSYSSHNNNGFNGTSSRRYENNGNPQNGNSNVNSTINARRVVGTRNQVYNSNNYGYSNRTDASSSRRDNYTRPSSTRSGFYNRGSYTRTYIQNESSRRSYTPSYNRTVTPTRNYSESRSYTESRRSSSFSGSFSGSRSGGFSGGRSGGGFSGGHDSGHSRR